MTRVEKLEAQLRLDRAQFLFYEGQHLAKKTAESDIKARVNREAAEAITRAIDSVDD